MILINNFFLKIFFINKMYDKNLFEIVYDEHKELYDLDTLNFYLIYMSFDELIRTLNMIDLNNNDEIIKINKDIKLFSTDWFLKYKTYKYNNKCLILYKQEPDYIKVAEIEFISVELSDIEFLFNEIKVLKKENENFKNKISELENLNQFNIDKISKLENLNNLNIIKVLKEIDNFKTSDFMSEELLLFFKKQKEQIKKNNNISADTILYEDNINIYLICKPGASFPPNPCIIYKQLYIYNYIDVTQMNMKGYLPFGSYRDDIDLINTIEIIYLGNNINYNEKNFGKNIEFRNNFMNNIPFSQNGINDMIIRLKKFKNLKKIILYDINMSSGPYHYFFKPQKEYIEELKNNFGEKLELELHD